MTSTSSELVSIPGCKATQLLGAAQSELGEGTLLALADPQSPKSILLSVGHAAFALQPGSQFYTHADDETLYYFPADSGDAVGSGSYVQLTLPSDVTEASSRTRELRDKFEDALLARGFLRAGPLAAADELGRSVAQDGHANAAAVSAATKRHVDSTEAGNVAVPEMAKDAAVSARDATAQAQSYTSYAADKVSEAAQTAGRKVAEVMPAMPNTGLGESDTAKAVQEVYGDTKSALSDLAQGVGDGSSKLGSTATTATHDLIAHDYGADAARTADNTGLAASNTAAAMNDLTMGTSTLFHGAKAAEGASQRQ